MSGIQIAILGALMMLSGAVPTVAFAADPPSEAPKPVLELFTSQGCSSCPPADELLGTYVARDDVIALSLPVDYWDSLGWKDTFGNHTHTDRQRDYAQRRGDGQVYTPQVVVNGRAHVVGSSAPAIADAIASTHEALAAEHVAIRLRADASSMLIEIGPGAPSVSATLWLALVQKTGMVAIRRGENAGRKITYHNVVRALKPVGVWTGAPVEFRVPKAEFQLPNIETATVLLQRDKGGPIIGAAEFPIESAAH